MNYCCSNAGFESWVWTICIYPFKLLCYLRALMSVWKFLNKLTKKNCYYYKCNYSKNDLFISIKPFNVKITTFRICAYCMSSPNYPNEFYPKYLLSWEYSHLSIPIVAINGFVGNFESRFAFDELKPQTLFGRLKWAALRRCTLKLKHSHI